MMGEDPPWAPMFNRATGCSSPPISGASSTTRWRKSTWLHVQEVVRLTHDRGGAGHPRRPVRSRNRVRPATLHAHMYRYIIRRLLWAVMLFFAVTMSPTSSSSSSRPTRRQFAAGRSARPADVVARPALPRPRPARCRTQYGLLPEAARRPPAPRPVLRATASDVNSMIGDAAPVTASLVIGGAILWMLLAIPIGVLSALRPRSLLDRAAMIFVLDRDLRCPSSGSG